MKVCSVCQGHHDDSTACEASFAPSSYKSREREPEVPGFRLDYLLASAHSAETYHARDIASGRTCLIKFVAAQGPAADQAIREAKIAANLFHPAVANFYDAGLLGDGRCFFVFENVEGRTLRETLDTTGAPDLLDTIEIIREAAEALHALHRSGIVHGAISPRSIIRSTTSGGQSIVRITDPDLGRLTQHAITSNRFLIDNELESLRYFSPEQCTGDDATVQSDVYGLGIVFYEMLAGFPPFQASTAVALIQQHMNELPPDIKIANFNLRMLVTHALTEALQKQTRLRQPSINTFARQLRHIEQLATHVSTPPPAGTVREEYRPIPAQVIETAKAAAAGRGARIVVDDVGDEHLDPVPATVTAAVERPRMISVEAALEEDRSTLTRLKTPVPDRPSLLQSWKKKLNSVTSMLAFEKGEQEVITPNEHVMDSATETGAVKPARRKIEWVQEDDDIPSVDDVRQVLAMENETPVSVPPVEAVFEPKVTAELEPRIESTARTPRKIEWIQPDDDLPSVDDIQLAVGDDDIPSLADVQEVAMEREEVLAAPAVEPAIERSEVAIPQTIPVEPVVLHDLTTNTDVEVVDVRSAISGTKVADLPQIEQLESTDSEPDYVVIDMSHETQKVIFAEPAVSEDSQLEVEAPGLETVDEAPEVIAAPDIEVTENLDLTPQLSPEPVKPTRTHKHHPVSAVRKRHKKLRKQVAEVALEQPAPPEEKAEVEVALQMTDATAIESDEATFEVQEIVVEPATAAPMDTGQCEPQEVIVERPIEEPILIQVEPSTPEPEVISAELSQPQPEAIRLEEPVVVDDVIESRTVKAKPTKTKSAARKPKASTQKKRKPKAEPVLAAAADPEPRQLVVEPLSVESLEIEAEPELSEVIVPVAEPEPQVIEPAPQIFVAPPIKLVSDFVPKRQKLSSRRRPQEITEPFFAEDDEITIVRPRSKRVRIHLNSRTSRQPQRAPATPAVSAEPDFVPTLLGRSLEHSLSASDEPNEMFGAFAVDSTGFIAQHRSHVIGGGIIAVLALFLFGSDFLSIYLQSSNSDGRITAEATRREATQPVLPSTTTPTVPDPEVAADKPAVVAEKKERTAQKAKSADSAPSETRPSHENLVKAMILVPSKTSQIESLPPADTAPSKRGAGAKVTSPVQPGTRPRVVDVPKR